MLLKSLINTLVMLEKINGNIEIVINDPLGGGSHLDKIKGITVVLAKEHCSGYFRSDCLEDSGHGGGKAFFEPTQSQLEHKKDISLALIK